MEHIIASLLQEFEQGKMDRRQLIRSLAMAATAASAMGAAPAAANGSSKVRAANINHIGYNAADHIKVRDFYQSFFGMKTVKGSESLKDVCYLQCGSGTYLAIRNNAAFHLPRPTPSIDHMALEIEPWENKNDLTIAGAPTLAAELKRQGVTIVPPGDPSTPKGVKIKDPEGFPVQLVPRHHDALAP